MSVFRSSNDDATSDQESSSEEHDINGAFPESIETRSTPDRHVQDSGGALLQHEEPATDSFPANEEPWSSTDWLPSTAEQHATLLTSSLLEFVYQVKAAEHLNYAQRTTRFHRESPEAIALGARMYEAASKVLASSGIIADRVHEDDWKVIRQRYVTGVDNLGLQVFSEIMSPEVTPRGAATKQGRNLSIRGTSRPRRELLNVLSSTSLSGRLADINQHREMMAAMVRNLAVPSPHMDVQLTSYPLAASCSRYKAEFWELKRLGRGGFGTVYHVKNLIDDRDYAIKKIPLDPKRLKSDRTLGAQEIESLLKEIRTLARLEHCNIVRYYAAWIESGDGPMAADGTSKITYPLWRYNQPASPDTSNPSNRPQQKELPTQACRIGDPIKALVKEDGPLSSTPVTHGSADDSVGIVFGEDSGPLSRNRNRGLATCSDQLRSQRSHVQQGAKHQASSEGFMGSETDIYTDGDGEVRSKELKQNASVQSMIVLHIQMSLHPLSLSSLLGYAGKSSDQSHRRHCFHLGPSLRLLRAIISGIEYLHSQGIVHRDIKPGNIFLSEHRDNDQRQGNVDVSCRDCKQSNIKRYLNPRIGDFGLVADISGLNETTAQGSSFAPKAVGTEFYRPPLRRRQSSNQAIDEKIDVFALGIILFEMLWKMDTKMERHMLLTNLSKNAILPSEFAHKIDPHGMPCPIEDGAPVGTNGPITIGACVEDCIRNMVCASSAKRWGCVRVREKLDEMIKVVD